MSEKIRVDERLMNIPENNNDSFFIDEVLTDYEKQDRIRKASKSLLPYYLDTTSFPLYNKHTKYLSELEKKEKEIFRQWNTTTTQPVTNSTRHKSRNGESRSEVLDFPNLNSSEKELEKRLKLADFYKEKIIKDIEKSYNRSYGIENKEGVKEIEESILKIKNEDVIAFDKAVGEYLEELPKKQEWVNNRIERDLKIIGDLEGINKTPQVKVSSHFLDKVLAEKIKQDCNKVKEAINKFCKNDGVPFTYESSAEEIKGHTTRLKANNPIEGIKETKGKLYYELSWEFIEEMAKRMANNKSEKYPLYNWKKDIDIEDLKQAINRHHIEVMKGKYQDGDEILGHVVSYACNAMMLWEQLNNTK